MLGSAAGPAFRPVVHHRQTSSAASSPTKSPGKTYLGPLAQPLSASKRTYLARDEATTPQAGASPNPRRSSRPLFGRSAGQPSRLTMQDSQDSAPNMGEPTPAASCRPQAVDWNIPAVRGPQVTSPPQTSKAVLSPKSKPGAAAKVSRRQAWLKFMAYDGTSQICLEAMMAGTPDPAASFLVGGCEQLKQALGLDQLLLPPAAPGGAVEAAIYWDDREEGATVTVENLEESPAPSSPPRQATPLEQRPRAPTPLTEQLSHIHVHASPLQDDTRSVAGDGAGPFVEARVLRVVGCQALTEAGDGANRGKRFRVVMHPAGVPADEPGHASLTLSPNGGVVGGSMLRLYPDSPRGTVMIELRRGTAQLATGTVQVAELHKLATQLDTPSDAAPSAGLFRHLQQLVVRRKEQPSSMTWCRLVDEDGATAGHAVVSARLVATEESLSVGALGSGAAGGTSESPSFSHPPPKPTAPPSPQRTPRHAAPAAPIATLETPVERSAPSAHVRVGAAAVRATSGGFLHVNAQHVYDELLVAALSAAGCGADNLVLRGPWAWLLAQFAERYGVRPQYASLAHLRWVMRRENAAPTATCLEVLVAGLAPLVQARSSQSLTSAELALLTHVCTRTDGLLTTCFDSYFALSEDARGGLADGVLSVRGGGTPPALAPAVELLAMTRGVQEGEGGGLEWLTARLRVAARKRFHALLAATESRRPGSEPRRSGGSSSLEPGRPGPEDDPTAAWAYGRLEELASCVMTELRADDRIHDSGALPSTLRLPEVTAVEYVRGVISHTQRVLARYPPPAPTPSAVRLVEAVGHLQDFVVRHGYTAAAARLNSRDIFGGFVHRWLAGTATGLARTLRALERAGPPDASRWQDSQAEGKHRVAPLVEGMLSEAEAEMRRYDRIVSHWPGHGPELEAVLVAALRSAVGVASKQCGLLQTKAEAPSPRAPPAAERRQSGGDGEGTPFYMQRQDGQAPPQQQRYGRVAWRWVQVGAGGGVAFAGAPPALRRGVSPYQALLLNSLRRLLAVVPQLEHTLSGWCGAGAHGPSAAAALPTQSLATFPPATSAAERLAKEAPDLGAHWAQLVKELRTEYYASLTLCAEAVAGELASAGATSVVGVLRAGQVRAAGVPALTQRLRRCLEETAPLLRWLGAALDGRVFVALARGLWDLAARDVLRFAEDLVEGGEAGVAGGAWRGRQHAACAVRELDGFYRAELSMAMGSDLQEKDLVAPQHAQRASALLADNSASMGDSFDVY